jgi:hypothetical protein
VQRPSARRNTYYEAQIDALIGNSVKVATPASGLDFARPPGRGVVLDGRNPLDRSGVEAAGVVHVGIGRGDGGAGSPPADTAGRGADRCSA